MKLLINAIGSELDLLVSTPADDHQPWHSSPPGSSPRILWAAEMRAGVKLVLVDEHPRRLIEVRSFMERPEVVGNVDVARRLLALGILAKEAAEARLRLPREIVDNFPEPAPQQMSLAFPNLFRAAG